jgi:hypothetical protein
MLGCGEDLLERASHHRLGEHVAYEVHTAALPLRSQHLADGVLESLVGVAEDELHAAQAACHERA